MEAASDNYWETYREAEQAKWDCETNALMADPCKEHFERASALAKEILDNIDQGYDETKSAECDQAKADYDECMKNPPEEDTYEGKKAKCESEFNSKIEAAKSTRIQAESQAASARDAAYDQAAQSKGAKMATIAAIEEQCNIPPPTTGVTAGGVTTGGTGTVVESGNPACSGVFSGYDSEIQAEINRLQQLYSQALAGGKTEGLGGTNQLSAKITQLRADMAAGPKKCTSDSDCGDITKVCCSETQVGWVVCSEGVCGTETEDCEEDDICAGKPAECTSGSEGAESSTIEISRVYIIGSPCNPTIQVLNLQKKDENSQGFDIVGNIPLWLGFSPVGGNLPQNVDVTVDCDTLQTEGTYQATAKITVHDPNGELINTIPINVTIEAVKSILDEDDDAVTMGGDVIIEEEPGEEVTAGGDVELIDEPEDEPQDEPGEEPESTVPEVSDREYTHDELAKMTQDEIRALGKKITISALSYNGKWFPFPGSQFTFCMSCPPMCEGPHYHGDQGFSLDLQSVSQPPYSNCYWGYDVKQILATPDEIINWFHNKP